jgi:hypothetical protein
LVVGSIPTRPTNLFDHLRKTRTCEGRIRMGGLSALRALSGKRTRSAGVRRAVSRFAQLRTLAESLPVVIRTTLAESLPVVIRTKAPRRLPSRARRAPTGSLVLRGDPFAREARSYGFWSPVGACLAGEGSCPLRREPTRICPPRRRFRAHHFAGCCARGCRHDDRVQAQVVLATGDADTTGAGRSACCEDPKEPAPAPQDSS